MPVIYNVNIAVTVIFMKPMEIGRINFFNLMLLKR